MNALPIASCVVILCLAATVGASVATAHASPKQVTGSDFTGIDNYVKTEMKRLGIPGVSLGIVHGDQIVHLQGYGVADASGRPVTPQTPIHIGSLAKTFTALAVMQLVEAGKVELDAPVQKYLPWFTLADHEAAAHITIRHLLNQSSGLSEKAGNQFWGSTASPEDAVRQMSTVRLSHPVGKKYEYCNMNYVILGLVVESASGQSYMDYVSEHIFTPLDMRNSFASHEAALGHGLSAGHYYVLDHVFPRQGVFPPPYLATGLMVSSAEDLTHYVIAQLNEGKYAEASVLSPQRLAEMHSPAIPMMGEHSFGIGWAVGPLDGVTTIRFTGNIGTADAAVMFQPETEWGVVLLGNASGFQQLLQARDLTRNVLSILNGHPSPKPVTWSWPTRMLYWGILLTPLLQLLFIGRGLLDWQRGLAGEPWQVIVTVVVNLAIALLFVFKIPGMIPFTLASLRALYPELGYGLLSGAALGIGWSIVYPVINMLVRKP